jgi:hypothetical protein
MPTAETSTTQSTSKWFKTSSILCRCERRQGHSPTIFHHLPEVDSLHLLLHLPVVVLRLLRQLATTCVTRTIAAAMAMSNTSRLQELLLITPTLPRARISSPHVVARDHPNVVGAAATCHQDETSAIAMMDRSNNRCFHEEATMACEAHRLKVHLERRQWVDMGCIVDRAGDLLLLSTTMSSKSEFFEDRSRTSLSVCFDSKSPNWATLPLLGSITLA